MAHRHHVQKHARGGATKETRPEHEAVIEHEAGLKRGGHAKGGGKVHGGKRKHRYARGGRAGADKHPFSSAHRG